MNFSGIHFYVKNFAAIALGFGLVSGCWAQTPPAPAAPPARLLHRLLSPLLP